jgi:hypothetical protein
LRGRQDYAKSLLDIEDALDETLGDAWDFSRDPIEIDVSGVCVCVCVYACVRACVYVW